MGYERIWGLLLFFLALANLLMAIYYGMNGKFGSSEFILHAAIFMIFMFAYLLTTSRNAYMQKKQ